MTFPISRRTLLGALLATPLPLPAAPGLRAGDLRVLPEQASRAVMLAYLLGLAKDVTTRRQERLSQVRGADVGAWQETNRAHFLACIGGLWSDRTPLKPRITGVLDRPGYQVRKIVFESLPEFYVTANLYVPDGKGPYPAVLSPCGHAVSSKAYPEYQRLFIGLARAGYVVLTWDTVGQGERFQLWDFVFRHRGLMDKSSEHGAVGLRECLLGQNIARYMIWDGLRALDYLAGLPEVDPARIGATGNSGGGTLTTYLSMLDPRIAAASIVTYTTSIPRKIEARIKDSEGDPEQDVPGLLAAGIDHTELVGMIAPRPVLIGAALRDFFPIQGTRETFAELQELYQRIGAAGRVAMVAFDHQHMYSQPLREATTKWFNRWLKGVDQEVHEPPATPETDEALQCTETGQVVTSLGGKRLFDFDCAEARRLEGVLEQRRRGRGFAAQVAAAAEKRLGLIPASPQKTNVADTRAGGLRVQKLVLKPEAGIEIPVRIVSAAENGSGRVVVYLRDREGRSDAPEFFERLALQGNQVVVADVRGFGESMTPENVPDTRMDYFHPRDGMDADYAYAAFSLGRCLLGMRVQDAVAVIRMARSLEASHPVTVVGRGWAGLIALFAAAVEPAAGRLAAEGFPASYAEIVLSDQYAQPVSLMVPGVLQDFDIADVLGSLAPRPVLVMNPRDSQTRRLASGAASGALSPAREAYRRRGADSAWKLVTAPTDAEIRDALAEWI
jgi:cephalosporin-C deacetylase-like acetyl esterase